MPKSPEEMAQSMINNLKEKTGKTLPQWLKIVRRSGEAKHGAMVKFLKTGTVSPTATRISSLPKRSRTGSPRTLAKRNIREAKKP